MIGPCAILAASSPLLSQHNLLAPRVFRGWYSSLGAAGLLMTSRSLELVLGTRLMLIAVSGSWGFAQLLALTLNQFGQTFTPTLLSCLVAEQTLTHVLCPKARLLEVSPHWRVGYGTLAALFLTSITETSNDGFNMVCGCVFALAFVQWLRRRS